MSPAAGASAAALRAASLPSLVTWLLAHGTRMADVEVSWSDSMGAGLVAKRDLTAGEAPIAVPRSVLLSHSSGLKDAVLGPLFSELQYELEIEVNQYDASQALIALQLLHAARCVQLGQASHWEAYINSLRGVVVNSPVLWSLSERRSLLVGTSIKADVRDLRRSVVDEYRRLRHHLRATEQSEWLAQLGLDASQAPCPLSSEHTTPFERYLLAASLVRSRAYIVVDDGEETHGTEEGLEGDELVMPPLIDLANHDDAVTNGLCWGDGETAPSDSLLLRVEAATPKGAAVSMTYGKCHTRRGSLLAFGFATAQQRPAVSYRLAPAPSDPHARIKHAVMAAADMLGVSGASVFEVPSDPPQVSGELLQTLRLLALPSEAASRLLDGAAPMADDDHVGFGEPPVVSSCGDDVWRALAQPSDPGIERAAYAFLLRDTRRMLRALRAEDPVGAPAPLSSVVAQVRQDEVEAILQLRAVARREAQLLPRPADA